MAGRTSRIAMRTIPRWRGLQAIKSRSLFKVVALRTAEYLSCDHLGGRTAVVADQSGARPGAAKARRTARRTERRKTLREALGQGRKTLHPSRIEMRPHVGFQASAAIRRRRGGFRDGTIKALAINDALGECNGQRSFIRPHDQTMSGKTDALEK